MREKTRTTAKQSETRRGERSKRKREARKGIEANRSRVTSHVLPGDREVVKGRAILIHSAVHMSISL